MHSGPVLKLLTTSGSDHVALVHVAQLRGVDGRLIEFVDGCDPPMSRREKWIVNVSTQCGCPVGCPYCDAGGDYLGNLSRAEIMAQIEHVLAARGDLASTCKKLKVHFSRMGEPALNDAVIETLQRLGQRGDLPGLWACLATIAPTGRARWFDQLLEQKQAHFRGRFQLQFSLNSTSEKQRSELIPFPHWNMEQIAQYGERFFSPGDRKVVLNFALAENVDFDPGILNALFDPSVFAVKLTPINPTARGTQQGIQTILRSARAESLEAAITVLGAAGYDVIVSVGDPREDAIGSNCGQAVRALLAQPQVESAQGDQPLATGP